MEKLVLKAIVITSALTVANLAFATTAAEARQMPPGSWPTKLGCNPSAKGFREEAIGTSDAGELVRNFPDPQCQ